MGNPPHPETVNDFWVQAVHDRLVEQNDLLRQLLDRTPVIPAPVEEPAAQPVLITEPAPVKQPPPRKQSRR